MIVIHHNPRCSKSRVALEMIEQSGNAYTVINYLETGWTRAQLLALLAVADARARDWLREGEQAAKAIGLNDSDADLDDESIIAAMCEHPELVNRPLICSARGVGLGRTPDAVSTLIE